MPRLVHACVLAAVLTATPAVAQEAPDLTAAIEGGDLTLELRSRYETANVSGVPDADALTARLRLGWQTLKWNDLTAAIEFDGVFDFAGDYNDGLPPAEAYATIADPDGVELNRFQLAWTPHTAFGATLGRQRIVLDDQRFVGAVGWRQDDQTFDALRFDLGEGKFRASYAYVDHVNRIFSDALDWESDTHLLNASYAFGAPLKLTAFAYLMDFNGAGAAQSNATYGIRVAGSHTASDVAFSYAASYATQSDHAGAPVSYEADYWALDVSAAYAGFTGRIGYESLEGNGPNQRFVTPLATGHIFQGWADVFLTTPNDGVNDLYFSAAYKLPIETPANTTLTLVWHDFEAERTGADLGEELDLLATASLTEQISVIAKYADYDGVGVPPDTTRVWFGLEFKL